MGNWYPVVKTKKGHRYVYLQQTYREGGHVRTRNRYVGPAGDSAAGSTGAGTSKGSASRGHAGVGSTLVSGALSFGKAVLDQFDAGRWGSDTAEQLGLKTPPKETPARRAKRGVTTTASSYYQHQAMDKHGLYDPENVSGPDRGTSAAIEKVFRELPDGTTDARGYIVKRKNKLFPTPKLTGDLQSYLNIQLDLDGSIPDGPEINSIRFTQELMRL